MIEKRILSCIIGVFTSGLLASLAADFSIVLVRSLGQFHYPLMLIALTLFATLWWYWKAGGGIGMYLLRLRLTSDSDGDASFCSYLIRNAHFILYFVLEAFRLLRFIETHPAKSLSIWEFLDYPKTPLVAYYAIYGWILVDKLAIVTDLRQKSLLDRVAKTNVVYYGKTRKSLGIGG